tara:strand:+ start:372 stop:629 length:258 start_codon:yes stop_codon:yes gene_type:complete
MDYKEIIGYFATIFGIFSFLPVIINIYKTKQTNNFPYKTLILALISNFLFLISGILKKDFVLIFMGIIFLSVYSFIFFTKFNNTK